MSGIGILLTIDDKKLIRPYKYAKGFQKYILKIKKLFIGKLIKEILIEDKDYFDDCPVYEFDEKIKRKLYWDKNANEDIELRIDSEITVEIEDKFFTITNIDKDSYKGHLGYKIGSRITEKKDENLISIKHYYSKNIINKKILDIYADDYFNLKFCLENGYEFCVFQEEGSYTLICENFPKEINELDYKKLTKFHYEKFSVLNSYINEIKNKLIGKKIKKIMRLGTIFNNNYPNDRQIELDEPIDILIGNKHLNIDFAYNSDIYIGINMFNYSETSYFDKFSWRSLNSVYKDNIINQTVKDIVLTKRDISEFEDREYAKKLEDDFQEIKIILENGYILNITNWEDYMLLDEYKI